MRKNDVVTGESRETCRYRKAVAQYTSFIQKFHWHLKLLGLTTVFETAEM